jgi:ssDNA-binding Zn-finger/Zn-ribbon topoisomerase 1
MKRDTYAKYPVLCLTCGQRSERILKQGKDKIWTNIDKCRCPKCSKTAYVLNPLRSQFLFEAMAKEIVRLKSNIFELECMIDGDQGER